MSRGLQLLVAAACVAVIALASYYFWGEYSRSQDAARRADQRLGAEAELFQLAKASPGDTEAVRHYCTLLDKSMDNGSVTRNAVSEQVLTNCRVLNYL